jgi:N-acetylglucosaminyldiphosphoundecaprenol N-acetyl-beta-D-mannosaminyltransferase
MGEKRVENDQKSVKRIKVLDVPVDVVDPDMVMRAIGELLDNGQNNQIVFLSTRGLLAARGDPELARCLREAALVLPVSRAIVGGARFLRAGEPSLFNQFEFVIRTLSLIEKSKGAVYLLGSRKGTLEVAEQNLLGSFHGIRVVGRYFGFYPRSIEASIVMAIKKSSPHLLLVGSGVAGREKWILRHRKELNPGLSLFAGNCFEVFAGEEKQVSKKLHAAGLGALSGFWRRPWKVAAVFPFLWFLLLLVISRLFRL